MKLTGSSPPRRPRRTASSREGRIHRDTIDVCRRSIGASDDAGLPDSRGALGLRGGEEAVNFMAGIRASPSASPRWRRRACGASASRFRSTVQR